MVGGVACAISVGIAIFIFGRQDTARAEHAQAMPAPPTRVSARTDGGEVQIPRSRPTVNLPSLETPLALVVDDLRQRVNLGEEGAGCRLAAEYSYCAQLPYRQVELDHWLAERRRALDLLTSPKSKQEVAESIDREMAFREQRVQEVEQHCNGVTIPQGKEVIRLWRDAALAGNPIAMKQYASGNAFRWGNVLDSLSELNTYKFEAEHVATVAAERGDMDMLFSLAAAYSPYQSELRSLLAQAIKPDSARALALYRHIHAALLRNGNENERVTKEVRDRINDLEKRLSGEELSRAQGIALNDIQSWEPPTVRGVHGLDPGGRQRDVDRAWCAR